MRKILVVIDMQNDFIDGSLGTKEAQQIVPRVVEKMKEYDPWNIYLTRDTHYENYLDTQEGRNLPIEHCIEGTHGWQLNDAVAKAAEKATVIDQAHLRLQPARRYSDDRARCRRRWRSSWSASAPTSVWCPTRCCSRRRCPKRPSPWTRAAAPASRRRATATRSRR